MNDIKILVEQKFDEVLKVAELKYPKLKFYQINLVITDLGDKVAGTANRANFVVKINERFLDKNSDYLIDNTIPHEIAHVVQFICYPRAKQAHGPEWRSICLALGGNAKRTVTPDTFGLMAKRNRVKRWVYEHPISGKVIHLTKSMHEKASMGYRYNDRARTETFDYSMFTGKIITVER